MGILSVVDEARCIKFLAYSLDERGSFAIIFPTEPSLVQTVLSGCHALPRIRYVTVVLSVAKCATEGDVNDRSATSAIAENAWRDTLQQNIEL
jgi:hypothetical protein